MRQWGGSVLGTACRWEERAAHLMPRGVSIAHSNEQACAHASPNAPTRAPPGVHLN